MVKKKKQQMQDPIILHVYDLNIVTLKQVKILN